MDESRTTSVLKSLELDASQIESLSESDLCTLIGFLDYDARLQARVEDHEALLAHDRSSVGLSPSQPFTSRLRGAK